MQSGRRPSTAADPAVPRFPLQLRRGPLLMFAATRRAAWASCALRACVRFVVARVCVVLDQHPQRTIAACNQAGLRVPGSGRDIQGGARAAPSASASSAARCCCCCFCGCQTALGRHHAGEDAPVGAKPTRTHPSCSATGTTRFPTFLAVARAQACRYSSPWTTPTTQADS